MGLYFCFDQNNQEMTTAWTYSSWVPVVSVIKKDTELYYKYEYLQLSCYGENQWKVFDYICRADYCQCLLNERRMNQQF